MVVFNKTIIPLGLVGYEMIIANLALRASLAINHLISNAPSWDNCSIWYTLFFLIRMFFFPAQAEYSYFSADFKLKIFLYYSLIIAYDISGLEFMLFLFSLGFVI